MLDWFIKLIDSVQIKVINFIFSLPIVGYSETVANHENIAIWSIDIFAATTHLREGTKHIPFYRKEFIPSSRSVLGHHTLVLYKELTSRDTMNTAIIQRILKIITENILFGNFKFKDTKKLLGYIGVGGMITEVPTLLLIPILPILYTIYVICHLCRATYICHLCHMTRMTDDIWHMWHELIWVS